MTGVLRPLVIVGAGGFGREVLDIVDDFNRVEPTYDVVGFVDDGEPDVQRLAVRGQRYLGPVTELKDMDATYVLAIGSGEARLRLDGLASSWGHPAATLVHPSCTVGSHVRLGAGTVLAAGARLTTNIALGRHCQLHQNATIGHDAEMADCVTLMPGVNVSGSVVCHPGVTLGTGAAVIQGVTIGADTYVGAGAVVVRDLPAGMTAVGVPARPLAHSG